MAKFGMFIKNETESGDYPTITDGKIFLWQFLMACYHSVRSTDSVL